MERHMSSFEIAEFLLIEGERSGHTAEETLRIGHQAILAFGAWCAERALSEYVERSRMAGKTREGVAYRRGKRDGRREVAQ